MVTTTEPITAAATTTTSSTVLSTEKQQIKYDFDRATCSSYIGESDTVTYYAGSVDINWAIGQVPAGGYVVALSLSAVLDHFSTRYQQHPASLNTFFFKKTEAGPFIVEITELKSSKKGFVVVKAVLRQPKKYNEKNKVPQDLSKYDRNQYVTKTLSIITMSDMNGETGITLSKGETGVAPVPPQMATMEPAKMDYMGDYVDLYQDKSTYPVYDTQGNVIKPGRAEIHHGYDFKDGRETDFKSLPYWADLFTNPLYSMGPQVLGKSKYWMPTLQLEVQFKTVPKDVKNVIATFKIPHIVNNRFDLDGALYDQHQNLLAITRHQCLVVPWERNVGSSSSSSSASSKL
ncbi:thioesterase-like superfamily-domain-containing protein [Phascolomyces articulosus]|uniref:Thioesterase-like superfamily-domain-containing protein n=1 Tax=Phascolomyces articulosus TaxID=60185 RepID=A0AAD5PHY8_9FUNG|nr:thioesterase-like superfamily-domain-containing protein [Phascolomyces articulosus]